MMTKYNIALFGGRGYVGKEIIKLLDKHPFFYLKKAYSSSAYDKYVENYSKNTDLRFSKLDNADFELDSIDIAILALPNNKSIEYVQKIKKASSKIIILDLSSDHRFEDDWNYRIPEIQKTSAGKYISNPGCYATAIQLIVTPLKPYINGKVSAFGISGYSGAGATLNDKNDPEKLKNNVIPYSPSGHIHELEARKHCYENIYFSPHVGNFFQGIHITAHIQLNESFSKEELYNLYKKYYENMPLIRLNDMPMIQEVAGKHHASLGGFSLDSSNKNLTMYSVIDNLLKGAATQAIQNLNSACGFDELLGVTND